MTTFRVRKRTRFGQRVVLVGSIPELGSWQILSGAVRCVPEGDDWWSATVCVEVPVSRVVGEESFVCCGQHFRGGGRLFIDEHRELPPGKRPVLDGVVGEGLAVRGGHCGNFCALR